MPTDIAPISDIPRISDIMPTNPPLIRTRLLRENGGSLSILITLPGGERIAADIRASDRRRLEAIYDLVEAPAEEQNFETCRVMILQAKTKEVES